MKVKVEKPEKALLDKLGVSSWPEWTCPVSEFDWSYDDQETCYFYEGEVVVQTPDGDCSIAPGDLVTFPKGLSCRWKVTKPVRKAYAFGPVRR